MTGLRAARRLMMLPALLLVGAAASARTIVVDTDGGDVSTLAEANKAAKAGDTVFIRRFTDRPKYGQKLALTPGVSYVSDGKMVVGFELDKTKNVKLRGFTFEALTVAESENVLFEQCRFRYFSGRPGSVEVTKSRDIRIVSSSFVMTSLVIRDSRGIEISGSVFTKSSGESGPMGSYSPQTGETKHWVASESYGPYVDIRDSGVLIQKNTFAGNDYPPVEKRPSGTWPEANESVVKDGVAVLGLCGGGAAGDRLVIEDNIFASSGRGLLLSGCAADDETVRRNIFFGNRSANFATLSKEQVGSEERLLIGENLPNGTDREGNTVGDPDFADPKKGNYALRPESPAVHMAAGGGAAGASPEALALEGDKPEKISPQYCDQAEPEVVFSTNVKGKESMDPVHSIWMAPEHIIQEIDSRDYFSMAFKTPIECCPNGLYIGNAGRFAKSFAGKIESQSLQGGKTISDMLRDDPDRRRRWAHPDAGVFSGLKRLRSPRVDVEDKSADCFLTFNADLGAVGLEGFFGRRLEGDLGNTPEVRLTAKGFEGRPTALAVGSGIRIEDDWRPWIDFSIASAGNVVGDDPARWYWTEIARTYYALKLGQWTTFRFLKPGHYRLTAYEVKPTSPPPTMLLNVE